MKPFEDEIIAEARRSREELLEEYNSIEGWRKHMYEERPRLEREGWVFLI